MMHKEMGIAWGGLEVGAGVSKDRQSLEFNVLARG